MTTFNPEHAFGTIPTQRAVTKEVISEKHLLNDDLQERYEEQVFFDEAFSQARNIPDISIRTVGGPFEGRFENLLSNYGTILKSVDSRFGFDHLLPLSYMPNEIYRSMHSVSPEITYRLARVRDAYRADIATLADSEIVSQIIPQTIEAGLLDVPPYCRQGDDIGYGPSKMTCFNACFRMVYAGITAEVPNEVSIIQAVRRAHQGESIGHDKDYLKVFYTDAFKDKYDARVAIASFVGADLNMLSTFTSRVKSKHPDASVYCILNIGTEGTHDTAIWHTNILLSADEESVICHDPSDMDRGAANRSIGKEAFARRWAVSFNRAHLVIVV